MFKVTKPRTDVKIAVDQWSMPPFMGLGSWVAFTPTHGSARMMGDTVVFEDEVNPAMCAALDAGLEVTAVHNHLFCDEPKVYFMHIGGHGEPWPDIKILAITHDGKTYVCVRREGTETVTPVRNVREGLEKFASALRTAIKELPALG